MAETLNKLAIVGASGHAHVHLALCTTDADGNLVPIESVPVQVGLNPDGSISFPASQALQQSLLAELKLANAPNGYRKNSAGEVVQVIRLVDGIIQSYNLVKTTDGTDTIYTPGAWA
jgi:hypothetical protein